MLVLVSTTEPTMAGARFICFAKAAANGPTTVVGAFDAPDGQLVGHANVDDFLGEWLPFIQLDRGPSEAALAASASYLGLSKSYGKLQDTLWYRKDDLRCELRGGF